MVLINPDDEQCAVCHVRKGGHAEVTGYHDWLDPEDHNDLHQPPNDDPNCDTCQSLAEAQWEARFDR